MPLVILGARLCPRQIEGSLYALIVSVSSIGGIVGDFSGTFLTSWLGVTNGDYSNLWVLLTICNLCSLFPLLFLRLVPKNIAASAEEASDASAVADAAEELELQVLVGDNMDL